MMLILMGLVLMLCWFFHVVADCFSPLCTRCRSGLSSCVEFMAAQMQGTRREICWCASMCGLLPNGAFMGFQYSKFSWQDPTSVQGCSWLLPWWPPDFLWTEIRGNGECTNSISRVPKISPRSGLGRLLLGFHRQEVLFGLLGYAERQWLKREVCFVEASWGLRAKNRSHFPVVSYGWYMDYIWYMDDPYMHYPYIYIYHI